MNKQQLAQAMREGIDRPNVQEHHDIYISSQLVLKKDVCHVCALGAAWVALCGGDWKTAEAVFDSKQDDDPGAEGWRLLARLLEIPERLALNISIDHSQGEKIETIAIRLEGEGRRYHV